MVGLENGFGHCLEAWRTERLLLHDMVHRKNAGAIQASDGMAGDMFKFNGQTVSRAPGTYTGQSRVTSKLLA